MDKGYMCHLAHVMRSYSQPSIVYVVYLKSQFISLFLRAFVVDCMCFVETKDQFRLLYQVCTEEDKNLLCEVYLHNLAVLDVGNWDPNPLVGDVQLRAFFPS